MNFKNKISYELVMCWIINAQPLIVKKIHTLMQKKKYIDKKKKTELYFK